MNEQNTQPLVAKLRHQAHTELGEIQRHLEKQWLGEDLPSEALEAYIGQLEQAASAHEAELRAAVESNERYKQALFDLGAYADASDDISHGSVDATLIRRLVHAAITPSGASKC